MNTFDNIDLLLKKNNKKQIELTNYLGVPKATYTGWKSGRTKSYTKYLPQIADFFGVRVDYLLGKASNEDLKDMVLKLVEGGEPGRHSVEMDIYVGENIVTLHDGDEERTLSVTEEQMTLLLCVFKLLDKDKYEADKGSEDLK